MGKRSARCKPAQWAHGLAPHSEGVSWDQHTAKPWCDWTSRHLSLPTVRSYISFVNLSPNSLSGATVSVFSSFSDCSLLHPWYLFLCNKQLLEEKGRNEKGFIWVHFPMVSPLLTLLYERTKVQGPGPHTAAAGHVSHTVLGWIKLIQSLNNSHTGLPTSPFPTFPPSTQCGIMVPS